MKKALLVVDYTNDFVAENGALTCGEPGRNIENQIAGHIKEFAENKEDIFFMIDAHKKNDPFHPETKLFPPHNIVGTNGRELYGKVKEEYDHYKAEDFVHYLDKTRYSAFAGTPLELLLKERGVTEIHLTGVCTDICVLHTAVDAYNLGYPITIYQNAVASFNQTGHEWALGHFESSLGASIK
ncbi:cysteine hydrolase family protein [Salimicrobium halophilum]|uniref:Nicotinamidase-related amidase n=1 Tax=Salimicrobium halophilum TaxID=86666 RepID=A0A1G8SWA7_9BACI|nr:isochorismatase family cysteine hydrolase [Salimicrobium halophilum]SDJ33538.1 Nicotinamidase-related amidase [Salimicrobium halophilum]